MYLYVCKYILTQLFIDLQSKLLQRTKQSYLYEPYAYNYYGTQTIPRNLILFRYFVE